MKICSEFWSFFCQKLSRLYYNKYSVDPYKNPVASSYGNNKSSGLKKFKLIEDLSTKEAKPGLITVKDNKNEKTADL